MLIDAISVDAGQLPALGFMPSNASVEALFEPGSRDIARVRTMLGERFGGKSPKRLVLLNANAGDLLPLRRWADERYVELALRLLDDDMELCIAVTGSTEEIANAEALVAEVASTRCVSVAGQTTLTELLTLYGLADVMVTNDSGPAHYATLTPLDVVTLFGPESPRVFGAQSARSHLMWAGLICSPCVNAFNQRVTKCNNNLCMQAISVDAVFEKVKSVLAQRSKADLDPGAGMPVAIRSSV
jgi:ADP-heptose:LPS heptosyltransferase